MSRYADDAARVRGQEPEEIRSPICCAPGCVLLGAIGEATNGNREWWCSVHHGAAYRDMPAISHRIRNRESLFRLAARLSNADVAMLVPERVKTWVAGKGRAQLLRDPENKPLTCRLLGSRLWLTLRHECQDIPEGERTDPAPNLATNPARVLLEGIE